MFPGRLSVSGLWHGMCTIKTSADVPISVIGRIGSSPLGPLNEESER